MACLGDVPVVLRRVGVVNFVKRIVHEVGDDHLLTWGAALAYSWLFALFPFLIFVLTLLPHLPDKVITEAYTRIPIVLYDSLPDTVAHTIWVNIERLMWEPPKGLFSIGLLVTIWAASGGVNMTMTALDRCYEVEKARSFVKRRLIAIAITVVVATLILAVLVLIPVGNLVTRMATEYWQGKNIPYPQWIVWLWNLARYALAGVLCFTVIGIMYTQGIAVKQRWRVFTPGSVFTIAVWIVLSFAFRWYVNSFGKESYNRTYGTVGGVAVLLLFFYLDALVIMIGAEINSEIDYELLGIERGSRDFTARPQPMFADASHPSAPPVAPAPGLPPASESGVSG